MNDLIEMWKDIPGYEKYYQASNLGKIRSCDRTLIQKHSRRSDILLKRIIKSKILKIMPDINGYGTIVLYKNNKSKRYKISRLILMTFDRLPNNGELACHYPDSNISNNRIDNLIWGTAKINSDHRKIHDTLLYGERNSNAKLKTDQVIEILILSKTISATDISKRLNIARQIIYQIINKITWKHINI